MSNVENTQPTDGQPTENATAAEQAAEAPSVPTAGAENAPTETAPQTEQQTEQSVPQETAQNASEATTEANQGNVAPEQLASDGDQVVEGLPEEDKSQEAPSSEA